MKKSTRSILIFGIASLAIVGGIGFAVYENSRPGQYDSFAQCLKEKKAIFYGAYWCPHCQRQKEAFGRSQKYLPYVECSTRDGKSQMPACAEKKIEGYPTWEFADGSRESGEVSFERLAEKTDCKLQQ